MLPHYLMALHNEGFIDVCVICDLKALSPKDLAIIEHRTLGQFTFIEGKDAFSYSSAMTHAPFYFFRSHNSQECTSLVQKLKIDCLVNAGTPRKLQTDILHVCPMGVINIHPGKLPKYRGCSSVEWSLYNDDEIANTVHLMNEDYDAGSILTIETYDKTQFGCYQDLRCHLYKAACELLPKALNGFNSGQYTFERQDENHASNWQPIDNEKFEQVKAAFPQAKQPLEYN